MFDSHCHLESREFATDRDGVLARARDVGVQDILIPAVGRDTWEPIVALTRTSSPRCHAALGIHPVALPDVPEKDDENLVSGLAAFVRLHRPAAVGECGLDTALDLGRASLPRQMRVLTAQLELACAEKLPVVLHARGGQAYDALTGVLGQFQRRLVSVAIHSYSGGATRVPQLADWRVYMGFGGPLTYAHAPKIIAALRVVPDALLLVETDAPDQSPAKYRHTRNEPAYLKDIIEAMAAHRGTTQEAVVALTTANARRWLGLPLA